MKHAFSYLFLAAASLAQAQYWEPLGLEGKTITAMYFYDAPRILYAATENEGVFRRAINADSGWVHINIPAQKLNAIHAFHTFCPLRCWKGILAGATRNEAAGDSALIYFYQQRPDSCPQPGAWLASDSGLTRPSTQQINAFAGSAVCYPIGPEYVTVFAGGREFIGRSLDRGKSWQTVWHIPNAEVFTLFSHRRKFGALSSTVEEVIAEESIWAGGTVRESGINRPFISYSFDFGKNWQDRSPQNFPGEVCRALAVDHADTNFIIAALNTRIVKSHNGGLNWSAASLPDLIVQFDALAINPLDAQHVLAGGTLSGQYFLLYESFDRGEHWHTVAPPTPLAGVSSIIFDPARPLEGPVAQYVYIGTRGNGIFRYVLTRTQVEETSSNAPQSFYLSPAFPNPSKLPTLAQLALRVHSPQAEQVRVRLLNTLGQEIVSWRVRIAGGEQTLSLSLAHVPLKAGVYFIQAEGRSFKQAVKWTIVE